ncbi:MAG: WD40 repeat domain-containing protein [Proteobacteria bacterium]|nr:WD40 repeat domain-containing protein [Pseudomonadota bacterium]
MYKPVIKIFLNLFKALDIFWVIFITQGWCFSDFSISPTLNHKDWILSVAISPNGRFVASAGRDNVIKIWDIYTKDEIETLYGHSDWVGSVVFSPDGKYILSGGWDNIIRLWDFETGIEVKKFDNMEGTTCVSFSPDGRYFLSTGYGSLKIWNIAENRIEKILEGHQGFVQSARFSKDGRFVVSGGFDGMVKLWDIFSEKELHTFIGHINFVHSVDFSPDGKKIISSGYDKTVKVWDLQNKRFITSLRGHSGWVLSAIYSEDGKYIISGDTDGYIYIWDSETYKAIRKIYSHKNWISSLTISSDNLYFLSGSCDRTVKIWDIKNGNKILTLGEKNIATIVTVSNNERLMACNDENNFINIWDIRKGKKIATLAGHNHPITSLVFTPDNNYLLSGSIENLIKVWDIKTGDLIKLIPGNSTGITSMTFSLDGEYLLTSGYDGIVTLWDWKDYKIIQQFYISDNNFILASFSKDNRYIATGGSEGLISVWDVKKNTFVLSEKIHKKEILSIAFSPKDNLIVTGGKDNLLYLFDFINNKKKIFEGHRDTVIGVSFTSDGNNIVSISKDKTVKVWDTYSGKLLKNILTNLDLSSLYLTKNTLLIGGKKNIIKIYNLEPFAELATIYNLKNKEWLFITSKGFYNTSCNGDSFFFIENKDKKYFLNQFHSGFCSSKIVKDILKGEKFSDYNSYELSLNPLDITPPEININLDNEKLAIDFECKKNFLKAVKVFEDGHIIHEHKLEHVSKHSDIIEQKNLLDINGKEKIIEIFASNDYSETSDVRLVYSKDKQLKSHQNLWLISMGISYLNDKSLNKLSFPVRDALAISKLFKNSGKEIFNKVYSFTINDITNKNPIKIQLKETIEKINEQISKEDLFILYLSGYSTTDDYGNIYLVVPDEKNQRNFEKNPKVINLIETLKTLKFNSKKIFILDLYDISYDGLNQPDYEGLFKYAKNNNFAIFISTKNFQAVNEAQKLGHSFLSYTIIEGLLKKADKNNKESISLRDLEIFLNYRVADISGYYENICTFIPKSYRKIIISKD